MGETEKSNQRSSTDEADQGTFLSPVAAGVSRVKADIAEFVDEELLRLKEPDGRMKAARVWMYCIKRHTAARIQQALWPTRDYLQREQEEAVQSVLLSRYPRYAGAITDFVTYCHATEKNIVPKSSAFAYVVLMGLPACRKAAVGMVRTPLDVAPVRYSVGIH